MKILSAGYALEKASGVTTFVEKTAAELRALGHEVDVADAAKETDAFRNISRYDIVHLHCLWQLHTYAKAADAAGVPIVWSTHGMTAPWSMRHKRWKKAIAWRLFQKRDLHRAALVHCTTQQEFEWNKRLGFSNCVTIPLGTDLAGFVPARTDGGSRRVLLFVGRIYPVKGLANLVKAWKFAIGGGGMGGWRLRIVGPDEAGHQAELERLVAELSLSGSVEFPGPKYGGDLDAEYAACDCLVLPSFTENFGATVADALAHGKPAIASVFTPWSELAGRHCGWYVSNEPPALAAAIRDMAALPDEERRRMGERGRALAEEKYSWPAVANALAETYAKLSKSR